MAVNLSFIGGAGWQFFDNNGIPLAGGKIYTYAAGTTTPLTTYTGRDGLVANTNPIILDSAGRTPQQIWSTEGLLYKYVVSTSNDIVIRTWDNIGGSVVASDLAQDLAAPGGASLVGTTLGGTVQTVLDTTLRQNLPFSSGFLASANPIGPAPGLVYFESARNNTDDMIHLRTDHLSGSSCYSLHIIDYSNTGALGGGSIGVALDGPGTGNVGTFNRRGAGQGDGIIASRLESGNGFAVRGNFAGTGTGGGVLALKQNTTGVPGGPYGTGPALNATNQSEQGEAIYSLTTDNNASVVSNVFERQNVTNGYVTSVKVTRGGTRTGTFTGEQVILAPITAWGGAFAVTGLSVDITPNVTGSPQVISVLAGNSADGNTDSYGLFAASNGANTTNYGGYFRAAGATNNFGIYVAVGRACFVDGVRALNLPVYPDNATASAFLSVGDFYRTATGQLMVVY